MFYPCGGLFRFMRGLSSMSVVFAPNQSNPRSYIVKLPTGSKRVQGGARGLAPPLEIEKQKKKKEF